jgi:hypothetical protein
MQGRENVDILLDYCARTLPANSLAQLDEHVAVCPECKELLGSQRQVWSALDEFEAAELKVSADFDRRLYARIEAEHREPFWVRGWRKLFQSGQPGAWRPAVSMSLAGVAVIGLLLVKMPNIPESTPEQAPSVKTAVIDKQDVERIDSALEDIEMLRALDSNSNAL